MIVRALTTLSLVLAGLAAGGCGNGEPDATPVATATAPAAPAVTNRIDVPASVRQNLGITFAKVERRPVQQTVRVPGQFELRPEATREYRAMVAGRAEILVQQFQAVKRGTPLVRLDSPEWRQMQHGTVEAEGEIKLAQAALRVAEASKAEAEQAVAFLRERLQALGDVGVRRAELEGQLREREAQVPKLDAELQAKQIELHEAREHYASILNVLASLSGVPKDRLLAPAEPADDHGHAHEGPVPLWRTLGTLVLAAEADGVVGNIAVTNGGWAETGALLLSTVDPTKLRFVAEAPQSDLARFKDGLPVKITPPQGGSVPLDASVDATLSLGFQAHPQIRTIPLYATPAAMPWWAKPGVAGFLEVFVGGSEQAELAIPAAAIMREGLNLIFFRRDPKNPDKVYPVEADLGVSDGRWTVVNSGLADGDEVVLEGAYALKLIGGERQTPAGYHYHADGSLHKDH
ncbi:MAG TPA: HlyD family efflux transporter periplasmic adaptor subunit [Tepidisphaeraceae bacterium]|jgi:hypothetical protein|nr:HlyD family efflux transporter periplasmic adaptor subunit [Tepidisphaeraceae bacterium]